jgi:hypothetical protein
MYGRSQSATILDRSSRQLHERRTAARLSPFRTAASSQTLRAADSCVAMPIGEVLIAFAQVNTTFRSFRLSALISAVSVILALQSEVADILTISPLHESGAATGVTDQNLFASRWRYRPLRH